MKKRTNQRKLMKKGLREAPSHKRVFKFFYLKKRTQKKKKKSVRKSRVSLSE